VHITFLVEILKFIGSKKKNLNLELVRTSSSEEEEFSISYVAQTL
jgi:hypothetical protein